jgi:4-hydroxyphenylpyruvate dioxygenase
MSTNLIGMDGIEFVEFASPDPAALRKLFNHFGFAKTMSHQRQALERFQQGEINLLLNREPGSYGDSFQKSHGPSISSMGWRVKDAKKAWELACSRGAEPASRGDLAYKEGTAPLYAIQGIGGSLIYFIDNYTRGDLYPRLGFVADPGKEKVNSLGFTYIDHLTNNVFQGELKKWSDFYQTVFEFTEVRYFDIRGVKTGLTSYALRSPCGKFCIPINEGSEEKSQINEYLRDYKGPGIQHLAFATDDIVQTVKGLHKAGVATLTIDDDYYQQVFTRVPKVTESHEELKKLQILVDGDAEGYILQIFTKNVVGPIFIEIIQRKNHQSFGEGNFGALFRAIERDQAQRGVL